MDSSRWKKRKETLFKTGEKIIIIRRSFPATLPGFPLSNSKCIKRGTPVKEKKESLDWQAREGERERVGPLIALPPASFKPHH